MTDLAGQFGNVHKLQRGFLQVSSGPYINYREVFGRSVRGRTLITERFLAGHFGALDKLHKGFWQVSSGPYINYREDFGVSLGVDINYEVEFGRSVRDSSQSTERFLAGQFGAIHKLQRLFWQVSSGPYINYREDFGRLTSYLTYKEFQGRSAWHRT